LRRYAAIHIGEKVMPTREEVLEAMVDLMKWQVEQNISIQDIVAKLDMLDKGIPVQFKGLQISENCRWLIPVDRKIEEDTFYDWQSFKMFFRISDNILLPHIKRQLFELTMFAA
jgi:hypothetical protein